MDFTKKYYLIGAVVLGLFLIIASFFIAWKVSGWIYARQIAELISGYEKQLGTIDRVANQKLIELQAHRQQLEKQLSAFEKKAFQELEDEKSKNDQLISALANSERRLRIAVSSESSGGRLSGSTKASSMGNERTKADIDPRDAAAIIRIVSRGDEAIKQLNACQEYFKRQ